MQSGGGDDGDSRGVEIGAPLRAEAAGDLAEDDAGPQGALAAVVGVGNVASGDEEEEIAAAFADAAGELAPGSGGRGGSEQPVEPSVEIGAVLSEGGVLEILAVPADADGTQQQLLESEGEAGVALVDGVLGIAQEMGEAELLLLTWGRSDRSPVIAGSTAGNPRIRFRPPLTRSRPSRF